MFEPRQKRQYMPAELFIDSMKIDQVRETSFLGVINSTYERAKRKNYENAVGKQKRPVENIHTV